MGSFEHQELLFNDSSCEKPRQLLGYQSAPPFERRHHQKSQSAVSVSAPQPSFSLLFVHHLPAHRDAKAVTNRLQRLSNNCGGKVLGVSGGCAVLRFASADAAERARKRMDNEDVLGHRITVSFSPGGPGEEVCRPPASSCSSVFLPVEKPRLPRRQRRAPRQRGCVPDRLSSPGKAGHASSCSPVMKPLPQVSCVPASARLLPSSSNRTLHILTLFSFSAVCCWLVLLVTLAAVCNAWHALGGDSSEYLPPLSSSVPNHTPLCFISVGGNRPSAVGAWPAVSRDVSVFVCSFAGDVWCGPTCVRLTSESQPSVCAGQTLGPASALPEVWCSQMFMR